jgi:predicted transcriptional regulator
VSHTRRERGVYFLTIAILDPLSYTVNQFFKLHPASTRAGNSARHKPPPEATRMSGHLRMRFGTFEANSIDLDQFWNHGPKDVVLAQIQTGTLAPEEMQEALRRTHQNLMSLKSREEAESPVPARAAAAPHAPADWRTSIARHSITCLECGEHVKQLTARHLRRHNLDARSYRAKYGIPRTQPLSARATAARRRQIAAAVKPWEKSPPYMKAQEERTAAAKKSGRKTRRR